MAKPERKTTPSRAKKRQYEADLFLAPGLRLVPASSSRQYDPLVGPVEGEFPQDNLSNDYDPLEGPENRRHTVGRLIDFFKKY